MLLSPKETKRLSISKGNSLTKQGKKGPTIEFCWSLSAARILLDDEPRKETNKLPSILNKSTARTPIEKSNVSPSPKIKKKRRLFEENNGKVNPIILSYSQLFRSTRREDSHRKTSRARLAFYPPINPSTQTLSDISSRRCESTTSTSISLDKSQISSTKSMPLPRKSKPFPIKHHISEE